MAPALLFAMVLAFDGCHGAAPHYEAYIAACEGYNCEHMSGANPQEYSPGIFNGNLSNKQDFGKFAKWSPQAQTRAQGDFPPVYLTRITYSSDHKELKREKVSAVQPDGIAFIDVDSKKGLALVTRVQDTYLLDINNISAAPQLLLKDHSALLAPCKDGPHPCVFANAFYGKWARTGADVDEIVFRFFAWTVGNDLALPPSIGAVKADGTGARILTSPPIDSTFGDSCPVAMPGGRHVLFTRTNSTVFKSGTWVALLDLHTEKVTVLDKLPYVAGMSGCPSADASGERFIYMSCKYVDAEGTCNDTSSNFTYTSVNISNPAAPTYENFIPVPLINAPSWLATFSITQCAFDPPALKTISCLGAETTSNNVLKLGVDSKGQPQEVDNIYPFAMCMSPECAQAHFVETSDEEVEGIPLLV